MKFPKSFIKNYFVKTRAVFVFIVFFVAISLFLFTKYINYSRGLTTYSDLSLNTLPDSELYEPEVIYNILDTGKIELADEMLNDCWTLPRYETVCFDGLPKWNENPFDEKYWRFDFYSLRPLRNLLWAYRSTDDLRYASKLIEILESYASTNTDTEYFNDKHATSFRVMMQVNAYVKLKNDGLLPEDLDKKLVEKITRDAEFLVLEENFEHDQNHGYTEASALILAGNNFKHLPNSQKWIDLGVERLDGLMREVVDADGIQVEQSPYYHFYTLDFAFQIYAWASKNDVRLSAAFSTKIKQMLDYSTYVVWPNGDIPMIGSSLQKNIYNTQDSVLRLLAELNDNFKYILTKGSSGVKPEDNYVLFPTGGQFIYKSDFGTFENFTDQTQLIFDVGPYRTNHSHLDALSVLLYSNKMVTLSDPGVFTYEPGVDHDYFFGTRAHNTVSVDDRDQVAGTAYAGKTFDLDGILYQSGWHNLYDGVIHKRAVIILDRNSFVVLDNLTSNVNHTYRQNWHLFQGADVLNQADTTTVKSGDQVIMQIKQANSGSIEFEKYEGEENPLRGWISKEYEKKEPLPMLEFKSNGNNKTFATLFTVDDLANASSEISVQQDNTNFNITVSIDDVSYEILITNFAMSNEDFEISEIIVEE